MKTVKEFKDAGLEFVEGDFREPISDLAVCFAWRTNTGEQPSFDGAVEFTFNGEGCEMKEVRNANSVNWGIVNKWRPVISGQGKMKGKTNNPRFSERQDIPECKPTYTKEMHEAGELPPVGSKFMLAKQINCQRLDQFQGAECTVIGHCKNLEGDDVITFSESNRGYACMCHLPEYIKPIDTRTEEEKLIDQACAEMLAIDDAPLDTSEKSIIEQMIKAGYRKP